MTIADKLALLEQTKEAQRVKLGLPESVPFSQYVKFIRDPFTPDELFKNGEQGVWLDPSDLSTMFQDACGVNPVTEDGDPVGLILDKSQGLEGAVTNVAKPFKDEISNRDIDITNTSEGTKFFYRSVTTSSQLQIFEIGKTYKLSVVYSVPETSVDIPVYNTGGGVGNFLFKATKGVRNKAEVTLTARAKVLYFRSYSGEITIHEVVLKEIKGNHATQETATSRPIYRTDGELHWLEFDGVDDYLESQIKGLSAFSSFIAGASFTTSKPYSTIFSGWVASNRISYNNIAMLRDGASYRARSNGSSLIGPRYSPDGNVFTYVSDASNSQLINPKTGSASNFTPSTVFASDTLYIGSAPESHGLSATQGKIWGVVIVNDNTNKDIALQVDKILSLKAGLPL